MDDYYLGAVIADQKKAMADLQSRLSEAQRVNDEYKLLLAERSWVSVEDRLPKENQKTLLAVNFHGSLGYSEERKGVVVATGIKFWTGSTEGKNVTHWMPLPDPPKQKKIDDTPGGDND